jgi:hypothetical protein
MARRKHREILASLAPEDRARLICARAAALQNDAKIVVNRLSELPEDWVKDVEAKARE